MERECFRVEGEQQDADQEAEVSEAGDDEGFLGGGHGLGFGVVEADQQVGGYSHQFPEDVHLEDVGGHDESQHGEAEEGEEGVVALESFFPVHVSQAVDVYHQGYGGDDDEHHDGDGVQQDAEVDVQVAREAQPFEVEGCDGEAYAFYPGHREVLPCRHVREQGTYRQG